MRLEQQKREIIGTCVIIGRRWFQKSYGNTYHSVTIYVNGEELTEAFRYGYGNHFQQTAHELLLKNGYNVPENYFDFINMPQLRFDVYDVERKKDL